MRSTMIKRCLALALCALATLCLAGCSSGGGADTAKTLNVAVAAGAVDDTALQAYAASLGTVDAAGLTVAFTALSMGDPAKDPMTTVASAAKLGGMVTAKEIDVLICSDEVALKYGENGASFIPFGEAYTLGAIGEFADGVTTLPLRDENGNPTGQNTSEIGAELTKKEGLMKAVNAAELRGYILSNTEKLDAAKAALHYIATH